MRRTGACTRPCPGSRSVGTGAPAWETGCLPNPAGSVAASTHEQLATVQLVHREAWQPRPAASRRSLARHACPLPLTSSWPRCSWCTPSHLGSTPGNPKRSRCRKRRRRRSICSPRRCTPARRREGTAAIGNHNHDWALVGGTMQESSASRRGSCSSFSRGGPPPRPQLHATSGGSGGSTPHLARAVHQTKPVQAAGAGGGVFVTGGTVGDAAGLTGAEPVG